MTLNLLLLVITSGTCCHLELIIQPVFNEYKRLFSIQFSCFSLDYEQLKEKIHRNHRKQFLMKYTCYQMKWKVIWMKMLITRGIIQTRNSLEMMKQIKILALLQMNLIFQLLLLTFLVHHLETLPLIFQSILIKSQPSTI